MLILVEGAEQLKTLKIILMVMTIVFVSSLASYGSPITPNPKDNIKNKYAIPKVCPTYPGDNATRAQIADFKKHMCKPMWPGPQAQPHEVWHNYYGSSAIWQGYAGYSEIGLHNVIYNLKKGFSKVTDYKDYVLAVDKYFDNYQVDSITIYKKKGIGMAVLTSINPEDDDDTLMLVYDLKKTTILKNQMLHNIIHYVRFEGVHSYPTLIGQGQAYFITRMWDAA